MLAEPPPSLRSVTTSAPPGQRRRRPPRAARRAPGRYWRRLLPVLAALALLTRLPSFRHPLWNPDEGYLAVQARLLAGGGTLYATVVDRKPPLLPWLYEAAFALCGDASLGPLRLAAAAAQLLTALALASTARRRWGDRAGRAAGVLYLLVSVGLNPEDAQAATFEVFMLPFTAAAVRCADRGGWTRAGLAVAGACLTKQTGGAVLAPVLWLLWQHPGHAANSPAVYGGWGCGAHRGGGLAHRARPLPVLDGHRIRRRTPPSPGPNSTSLARGLANTALLAAGCAGLLPPGRAGAARSPGPAPADLWLWLAASAGAVLLGFHFFGHYYLQLIPPLVLLATGALQILPAYRLTGALLTSACACALFLLWGLLAPRPDLAHTERLAAAVEARTGAGRPGPGLGHTPRDVLAGPPRPRQPLPDRGAAHQLQRRPGRPPGGGEVRRRRAPGRLPRRARRPTAGAGRGRLPGKPFAPAACPPCAASSPAVRAERRRGRSRLLRTRRLTVSPVRP